MTQLTEGVEYSQNPEDTSNTQARIAREKIVDFKENRIDMLHDTSITFLPLILNLGLVSHAFARNVLKIPLTEGFEPLAQEEARYANGLDMISVTDPQAQDVNPNDMFIVKEKDKPIVYTLGDKIGRRYNEPDTVGLIISGRLRDTNKMNDPKIPEEHVLWNQERFVKRRIPPRDILGIVAASNTDAPLKQLEVSLLERNLVSSNRNSDGFGYNKEKFLERPFKNTELEEQRIQYQRARKELIKASFLLASIFGFIPSSKKYSEYGKMIDSDLKYFFDSYIPVPLRTRFILPQGDSTGFPELDREILVILESPFDAARHTEVAAYFKKLEDAILGHEQKGKKLSLIEFGQLAITDDVQSSPNWDVDASGTKHYGPTYARGFKGFLDMFKPSSNPNRRSIKPKEVLEIMKNIAQLRITRAQLFNDIWPKYLESVAGKPLDQATDKDFLVGLCKEHAIPLYDHSGNVLWPEPEE